MVSLEFEGAPLGVRFVPNSAVSSGMVIVSSGASAARTIVCPAQSAVQPQLADNDPVLPVLGWSASAAAIAGAKNSPRLVE